MSRFSHSNAPLFMPKTTRRQRRARSSSGYVCRLRCAARARETPGCASAAGCAKMTVCICCLDWCALGFRACHLPEAPCASASCTYPRCRSLGSACGLGVSLEQHHRSSSEEGSRQLFARPPPRHRRRCCRRAGCARGPVRRTLAPHPCLSRQQLGPGRRGKPGRRQRSTSDEERL